MEYIKVKQTKYRDPQTLSSSDSVHWNPAEFELLSPNLKEWVIHYVLRKHFTFGQPYCVVCGREEIS